MKPLLSIVLGVYLLKLVNCEDTVVELINPRSKIRGHTLKSDSGKEFYAFEGIPYALPTTGKGRLSVPRPHGAWSNVLDVTKNNKICMQTLKSNTHNLTVTEDCLYLNVYTPRKPGKNQLATVFWIHPGDFMTGGGVYQLYNPEYFMDYDIIVVTINYRLGAFGFFTVGDDWIPGSLGLRDQVLALTWVNENIQAFGGNSDNVALVGHGAGAASAAYHYQLGRATPFSCAILQSGSSLSPRFFQPDPLKYAKKFVLKVNPKFNFGVANLGKALLGTLEKLSSAEFLKYSEQVQQEEEGMGVLENLVWLPVLENYMYSRALIVDPMMRAWTEGTVRTVKTMYGFTSGELSDYAAHTNLVTLGEKYDRNPSLLINSRVNVPQAQRAKLGSELKALYTNKTWKDDHLALTRYLNDQMVLPILKHAFVSKWFLYNYIYKFSYKSQTKLHKRIVGAGFSDNVAHGEELKLFWKMGKLSAEDRKVQKTLLTMWTTFIKDKVPSPLWPSLEEFGNKVIYLEIGDTIRNGTSPALFDKINPLISKSLIEPLTVF